MTLLGFFLLVTKVNVSDCGKRVTFDMYCIECKLGFLHSLLFESAVMNVQRISAIRLVNGQQDCFNLDSQLSPCRKCSADFDVDKRQMIPFTQLALECI